ncbi:MULTISPECIES: phage/plasmid replication protein, II/X family [Paraburkholderia]|uniref:phage/plasmid replication protein, II/X family n=1 Tax=Paraburkholderia TaxID=1822464 RepID=UPI0022564DD2|nr:MULTISPECIES: phage/plasmid replication protein, II/X family [Paraburkholderia]MCX4165124.1 phage/plasmid replication protein, II/X family [Paraburkholderia megapolitana]MDN7160617.1 phage/plasmid replication protein, II/X family [Paraburkholderia sp. CHISQ3]MDQ6497664.1 phage/plasmid replication protein, II/X family [Paraburkholderia megapolitana]
MIDLLDIEISHPHRAFGNKRIKVSDNRPATTSRFSSAVQLVPNGARINATSLRKGTAISIKCNPLKVLQGHNVFGTNNLRTLAAEIIVRVLDHLNIIYADDDVAAWVAGEFDIHAVDITHRYRLPENVTVFEIRQHMIRNMAFDQYRPSVLREGEGVRFNASSSYAGWIIYDKRKELEDKRHHAYPALGALLGEQADEVWKCLLVTAKMSARVELKLGKKYLEQRGLNRGSAWTLPTANEIYDRELAALRLERHNPMNVLRDSISAVTNPTHRRTLEMWASGSNLKTLFSRGSLAVHRKAIIDACGIDVERDVPAIDPLPVSQMFDVSNRLEGAPNWARQYPRAYVRFGAASQAVQHRAITNRKSRWGD